MTQIGKGLAAVRRRRVWAVVACMAIMILLPVVLVFETVTQIGLMENMAGLGLRINGVLFGATIAGPTVWLWPLVVILCSCALLTGRGWSGLFWAIAPIGLMFCGDGITTLANGFSLGQLADQFGLSLALENSGRTVFALGGDLPATAGFFMGQLIFLKKAVFDPISA